MLIILCFLALSFCWDNKEGCNNIEAIEPFYKNLYEGKNLTLIPKNYLEKMKELSDFVSLKILEDFPPNYEGEYAPAIYWGTAGRALLCLRLFRDSKNNKTKQEFWLKNAKNYIDYSLDRFKPYNFTGDEFGFQKGRVGIISVGAVIYDLIGNKEKTEQLISEVNWIFDQVEDEDYYDWESGAAGLIYAADFLKAYFKKDVVEKSKILRILIIIHSQGMKYYNKTTKALQFELYKNHFWTGVGSHGSGSPVYSLLLHSDILIEAGYEIFVQHAMETVDYYLSIQTSSGQIPGDLYPDRTQWCHGIPGLLSVIGEAYIISKKNEKKYGNSEKYKKAGVLGSKLISEIGILTKGMTFCHGVGGNIYMLADFYRKTKEQVVLSRIIQIILTSLDTPLLTDPNVWQSFDCLPDGLFVSSSIGMVVLFSDIVFNHPNLENIQMPSFHNSI